MLGDGLVPTELAAAVGVPTIVLTAAAMPEAAQALVDAMPDARLQTMESSAHELAAANIADKLRAFFIRQPRIE